MGKPILCLDFDGVLHSYTSGWKGASVIPDPPVPGAIAFLREAVKSFEVHIFSSRSCQDGGGYAMRAWLGDHIIADDPQSSCRIRHGSPRSSGRPKSRRPWLRSMTAPSPSLVSGRRLLTCSPPAMEQEGEGRCGFEIQWLDRGRDPQCAPNPEYPLGIDIDTSGGATRICKATLPWPASAAAYGW